MSNEKKYKTSSGLKNKIAEIQREFKGQIDKINDLNNNAIKYEIITRGNTAIKSFAKYVDLLHTEQEEEENKAAAVNAYKGTAEGNLQRLFNYINAVTPSLSEQAKAALMQAVVNVLAFLGIFKETQAAWSAEIGEIRAKCNYMREAKAQTQSFFKEFKGERTYSVSIARLQLV